MTNKYWEVTESDIPLIEFSNIFVGNSFWIKRGIHNDLATFDLVVRDLPKHWGFYIFDGLERFVDMLVNYRFDDESVKLLKSMKLINDEETEAFYRNFKFSGDIHALKDGTIFFPGEPIVRVTAPLGQANLITAFVLNAFGYPIRALTKITRIKLSAKDKKLGVGTAVRLPGFEQSIFASRASYIQSGLTFSPVLFRKFKNIIPPQGISANINHAVIKSFDTEADAYRYVFDNLQDKAALIPIMVDTYDFKKGLLIFIDELKKSKNVDKKKFLITIDSGDLSELSFHARKVLDDNGLQEIGIFVGGNLDEYKIEKHVAQGCPIDYYGLNTEYVNISDNPSLEAVYKMAQLVKSDGTIEYKAKLVKGKESWPGSKQVFRVYKEGKIVEDIIGFEDEKLGTPLLVPVIKNGNLIESKIPDADFQGIKKYIDEQLSQLAPEYVKTMTTSIFPVKISQKLIVMTDELKKKHIK